MKTTVSLPLGGPDQVRLVLLDKDRQTGTFVVTGEGVAWECGGKVHEFSWAGWARMIEDRERAPQR